MLIGAMDFSLRLTTKADIPQILEFERVNRRFFEQYLPPRPGAFFSDPTAFRDRMTEFLAEQAADEFLMFVLLDGSSNIIGRINLTILDKGEGTLGYRLAERCTGNGVLSRAIQRLCPIVKRNYKLSKLSAFAAASNPASVYTLLRAGFAEIAGENQVVTHNNAPLTLQKYEKSL